MNITRLEQQIIKAEQLPYVEHDQPPRPTGAYTLKFYNKQKRLITQHTTIDCYLLAQQHEIPLLGTPLEYMIRLNHTAFYKRNEYGQLLRHNIYSYVDIFCDEVFICRHFYRDGRLSPIVSYESDINKDKISRLAQIALKPFIDWNKLLMDAAFNRVDRNTSAFAIVNNYSTTTKTQPK